MKPSGLGFARLKTIQVGVAATLDATRCSEGVRALCRTKLGRSHLFDALQQQAATWQSPDA